MSPAARRSDSRVVVCAAWMWGSSTVPAQPISYRSSLPLCRRGEPSWQASCQPKMFQCAAEASHEAFVVNTPPVWGLPGSWASNVTPRCTIRAAMQDSLHLEQPTCVPGGVIGEVGVDAVRRVLLLLLRARRPPGLPHSACTPSRGSCAGLPPTACSDNTTAKPGVRKSESTQHPAAILQPSDLEERALPDNHCFVPYSSGFLPWGGPC